MRLSCRVSNIRNDFYKTQVSGSFSQVLPVLDEEHIHKNTRALNILLEKMPRTTFLSLDKAETTNPGQHYK